MLPDGYGSFTLNRSTGKRVLPALYSHPGGVVYHMEGGNPGIDKERKTVGSPKSSLLAVEYADAPGKTLPYVFGIYRKGPAYSRFNTGRLEKCQGDYLIGSHCHRRKTGYPLRRHCLHRGIYSIGDIIVPAGAIAN
jgi:hypothetical protein